MERVPLCRSNLFVREEDEEEVVEEENEAVVEEAGHGAEAVDAEAGDSEVVEGMTGVGQPEANGTSWKTGCRRVVANFLFDR